MPKKYRVEMRLIEDASNTPVGDPATINEEYETEAEATEGFGKKVDAARKEDKGKGQGNQ